MEKKNSIKNKIKFKMIYINHKENFKKTNIFNNLIWNTKKVKKKKQ